MNYKSGFIFSIKQFRVDSAKMSSVASSSPSQNNISGSKISEAVRSDEKAMDFMKISCSTKKSESLSFTNTSESLQPYKMMIIDGQSSRMNQNRYGKTIWWLLNSLQSLRNLQIKQKLFMLEIGTELIIRYLSNGQKHKDVGFKMLGISTLIFLLKVLCDSSNYLTQQSQESIYCAMGIQLTEQYRLLEEIQMQMMDYFININLQTSFISSLKQTSINTKELTQSMQLIINFMILSYTDGLPSVSITKCDYDEIRRLVLGLVRLRNEEEQKHPIFAQFQKALGNNEKIVIIL